MSEAPEADTIVEVEGLSRLFRKKHALNNVSFKVRKGTVFGLVGENGAGKTTLIKHLLGSFKAQTGLVRVFGKDPVIEPVFVLSNVGYLSENRDLPLWMRVRELMRYLQSFYPNWDSTYAEELRLRFDLPADTRIRELSRGQKARLGLLVALAHRPQLLILDEPSSGLDALARRDILSSIVRSVAEDGRTVLFSSHLLDEVERVADDILMLHAGNVTLHMSMEELKTRHRRYLVCFPEKRTWIPELPGVLFAEGDGRDWAILCFNNTEAFMQAVREANGTILETNTPTLEQVFVARASTTKLCKPISAA